MALNTLLCHCVFYHLLVNQKQPPFFRTVGRKVCFGFGRSSYDDYSNEMLCAAIQAGDDYAKAVLIKRNRRWGGKLAEFFRKMLGMDIFATSAAIDDLIQAGNMALLRAAERYEPNKAPAFLAFAKKIVLNAMRTEAKREYTESPLRLLESDKVRTVLRLDDSYDEVTDSSLSECIPDERELTPEAWYERKGKARSLWEALKALNPHDREFIMLRYQLGNRSGNTEPRKGVLPFTEAARLSHISLSRAKRIELDALAFLKRHIEEQQKPMPAPLPSMKSVAKKAAEALLAALCKDALGKCIHVKNVPFFACSADHPETIAGTADMVIISHIPFVGEHSKRSAYVPEWMIASESWQEMFISLDFPSAKTYLHLRIDGITTIHTATKSIEEAPDLTEWLWFLASALLQKENPIILP